MIRFFVVMWFVANILFKTYSQQVYLNILSPKPIVELAVVEVVWQLDGTSSKVALFENGRIVYNIRVIAASKVIIEFGWLLAITKQHFRQIKSIEVIKLKIILTELTVQHYCIQRRLPADFPLFRLPTTTIPDHLRTSCKSLLCRNNRLLLLLFGHCLNWKPGGNTLEVNLL